MNEPLRLSPADVTDWFMECDNAGGEHKIPHVILNDKLMTDALLGTIPIKTEHSYSLTSDGDSMPDSPSGTKIEGEFIMLMANAVVLLNRGNNSVVCRLSQQKKRQISCQMCQILSRMTNGKQMTSMRE